MSAAQLVVGDVLADGRFDQGRPREIEARAFGHQHGIAEHRQVGTTGNAVAHDRSILGDSLRREDGVVAKDPAEIVVIRKDFVLHRQEDARRVDEVDQRQAIGRSDRLGPQDLLDGERKTGPGLHGRIVGNHHDASAVDRADHGQHSRGRRPAPLLVHRVTGPETKLEHRRALVEQDCDPLARRLSPLLMLARNGLGPAAQSQQILLRENLRRLREQPGWFLVLELGRHLGAGHRRTRRK